MRSVARKGGPWRVLRRRGWVLTLALVALACVDLSGEQEVELGAQTAAQVERQLPLVRDPVATKYLTDLGLDIARRTSRASLDWRFSIVDSDEINAFAVPGGFIYVNRGLIERTRSLDELAGVLGHEIAHVTLRHSVKQMEQGTRRNVVVGLVCTFTEVCESGLGRVAIDAAGSAWFARHSRADERQADSAAIDHVIRADIDPEGIPAFFERLLEERRYRPGIVEGWFGSHPLEEERIADTRALIDRIEPARLDGLREDTPDYQAFLARVRSLPRRTGR